MLLETDGDPTTCDEQARLAADVAYSNCLLNGGSQSACEIVRDQTYQQVYDECIAGPGGS